MTSSPENQQDHHAKTLDLEPNPFEQSFAQTKKGSASVGPTTAVGQHLSPPVLTPGGSRRIPSSMLPPPPAMVSPGNASAAGTPGLWSALFENAAGGSGSSQFLNMAGAENFSPQTPAQVRQFQQLYQYAKKSGLTPNESSIRSVLSPQESQRKEAAGESQQLLTKEPLEPSLRPALRTRASSGFSFTTPGGSLISSRDLGFKTDDFKIDESMKTIVEPDPARDEPGQPAKKKQRGRKSRGGLSEEEKRQSFLERNRLAASKCRQRKKEKVEQMKRDLKFYSTEHETLSQQVSTMKQQILTLRSAICSLHDLPEVLERLGGAEVLDSLLRTTDYTTKK